MKDKTINYETWIDDALLKVVYRALKYVETNGFPDQHHYYITFCTSYPGVDISEELKRFFPEEMTIVLQHQFWDLSVRDDVFAVTLSFNGKNERIRTPWKAITAFTDPSVNFGLHFKNTLAEKHVEETKENYITKDSEANIIEMIKVINNHHNHEDSFDIEEKQNKTTKIMEENIIFLDHFRQPSQP